MISHCRSVVSDARSSRQYFIAEPVHRFDDAGLGGIVESAVCLIEDEERARLYSARATPIRWRCPPESLTPRSPITLS